jgi:hypothetical protein
VSPTSSLCLNFEFTSGSIANVTIPKYTHELVVPDIAQKLTLFPNLHTLQLLFQFFNGDKQQVFSGFRYPNIHTLSFSYQNPYPDILVACPNTKHFSFHKDRVDPFHRRPLFDQKCSGRVEKLGLLLDLQSHVAGMRVSLYFELHVFF